MPYCPEFLLQHFIKNFNQTKLIQSLLITNGYLIHNPNLTPPYKWQSTLFYFNQPNTFLLLFTHMLHHNSPPNTHTFLPLLKASAASSLKFATSLHLQALMRGVLIDPFVQTSLVNLYSMCCNLRDARKVFDEMSSRSLAYCKNGDMGYIVSMFNCMIERDVVSWSCVINGFVINGCFFEAIQFLKKMIDYLVRSNEATFVSLLFLCSNGESFRIGKKIHGYNVTNGIHLNSFLGTGLIDLYGKARCLDSALRVFDQIVYKKVCTWNAMILSLASNGRVEQALVMFEKMKIEGSNPNKVTFVAVLTACSHAKLVNIGFELFRSMVSEHKVVLVMENYGCMVDLMGRAGLLNEANEFVQNMPFEPNSSILGSLLAACKIHRSIEMGNKVGKKLIELQPTQCGQCVMLSNINAQVDRWLNAADLRKAMINSGIRKTPGLSLIGSM